MGVLTPGDVLARELAMTRMEEEADQLGADGIVGVRLDVGRYEWGADMAEFIAIGTAIKHKGGKVHRAPNGRPFTSDLSGQAFWTLMQTGKRPVGLVMGNCVYHVAHRGMMQSMRQTGQNVELEQYTQALYDARELAMERMQKEAEAIGDGVLGIVEVKLSREQPRLGQPRDRVLRARHRRRAQRARRARTSSCPRSRPVARHQRLMCSVSR
jgi:uncharacterized protein YbjQ (UPF0145 family)